MSENNNVLEKHEDTEGPAGHAVVGIRFRPCGKIYTFEAGDIDLSPGFRVIVESEMGLSLGFVARPKHTIEKTKEPLKKVLRIASDKDFETIRENRSLEEDAKAFCIEKTKDYKLQMKIVTTNTTLDKKRLIFYFTADGRIDFRELVRDLAAKFKTRIEMRQIGVRDEVRLIGGIGVCGRQACCSLFLTSFAPITIKMAKQQDLSINQSKLSGICGRLMCCLGYEFQDSDEKQIAASKLKDKTEAEESGGTLKPVKAGETQLQDVSPGKGKSGNDKEEAVTPPPEKTIKEEISRKRRRSRRRRRGPGTASGQGGPVEKPGPVGKPGEGQGQQTEQKDKGKPFSKRRKFWRKKKN
jgi:cell fate regulator YaaT (PSP1 superfamily)